MMKHISAHKAEVQVKLYQQQHSMQVHQQPRENLQSAPTLIEHPLKDFLKIKNKIKIPQTML